MEGETPRPESRENPRWSAAHRIALRFVVCYFLLYLVPAALPFTGFLVRPHEALWTPIVTWVVQRVFHTRYEIYPIDGEAAISNTAYGSILFLCYLALAAVATLIWSALDRGRPSYERLDPWLRAARLFSLDGKVIPPLTDPQRWRWVTFQDAEVMSVELAIGSDQRYTVDVDMPRKRIILAKTRWDPERGVIKDAAGHPVKEPGWQAELAFAQPTPDDLVLDGLLDGHRLHAKLSKIAQLRDNFRWIIVLPKEDR